VPKAQTRQVVAPWVKAQTLNGLLNFCASLHKPVLAPPLMLLNEVIHKVAHRKCGQGLQALAWR
jgi:hypothetical protein